AFEYTRIYTTERESRVVDALHRADHPVPAVLGFCPDPAAILMDFVEGRDDFHAIRDDAQRRALTRHFMEILVRQHALDPKLFADAGLEPPRSPEAFALDDLRVWERAYEKATSEPVPLITFTCAWLRRARWRRSCWCRATRVPATSSSTARASPRSPTGRWRTSATRWTTWHSCARATCTTRSATCASASGSTRSSRGGRWTSTPS